MGQILLFALPMFCNKMQDKYLAKKNNARRKSYMFFFERIIFCALGPQAILEATSKVRDVEGVSQNSAFASKRLKTMDCFGSFMACIATTHSCPNETLDGKDWQNMCFSKVKMAGRISSKMNVTVQK